MLDVIVGGCFIATLYALLNNGVIPLILKNPRGYKMSTGDRAGIGYLMTAGWSLIGIVLLFFLDSSLQFEVAKVWTGLALKVMYAVTGLIGLRFVQGLVTGQ